METLRKWRVLKAVVTYAPVLHYVGFGGMGLVPRAMSIVQTPPVARYAWRGIRNWRLARQKCSRGPHSDNAVSWDLVLDACSK
jgi:hypothetical protein